MSVAVKVVVVVLIVVVARFWWWWSGFDIDRGAVGSVSTSAVVAIVVEVAEHDSIDNGGDFQHFDPVGVGRALGKVDPVADAHT